MVVDIRWLKSKSKKTKRLFYFTGHTHVLEILLEKKLKISDFRKCNDLFELSAFELGYDGIRRKHKEWVEEMAARFGLICFSEDWKEPLMWAHYANNGTGLCLVLDVINSDNLRKVTYSNQRASVEEKFRFPTVRNGLSQFHDFCSQKASGWRYEREWRLFVDLKRASAKSTKNGMNFLDFGSALELVGVINGPRPYYGQDIIKSAVKNYSSDLNYLQSRLAYKKFEIVSQQNKDLWKS